MWQSAVMALDLGAYDVMTFDCYGTLIDWETGILAAMRRLLAAHDADPDDESLLVAFAAHEARLEAGPYRRYREVLAEVAAAICAEHGITAGAEDLAAFGGSVADWPAFDDSAQALARLADRYRLAVLTNCDDDLFEASARRLGVTFDPIVTAEQVRSYKPSRRNFEVMFERLGIPRDRILHVAQSLFHDHVPGKALGLATVWVDRRRGRSGHGATPPAAVTPDLTVPDMASLADLVVGTRENA
jgi:2-haloacid dehalogenase